MPAYLCYTMRITHGYTRKKRDSVQIICIHILISFCFTSEEILFRDEKLGHIHPSGFRLTLFEDTKKTCTKIHSQVKRERERESVKSIERAASCAHINNFFVGHLFFLFHMWYGFKNTFLLTKGLDYQKDSVQISSAPAPTWPSQCVLAACDPCGSRGKSSSDCTSVSL